MSGAPPPPAGPPTPVRLGGSALALAVLLAVAVAHARAQTTLVCPAAEGASEALLGFAVAAAGGVVAAAAPHASVHEHTWAGAVHLFAADDGRLLRTLVSPVPAADENFGFTVAMDDAYVLVGAPRATLPDATLAGAAYLFERETGTLLRRFREPHPGAHHEFGLTVAVSRGRAVIGSPGSPASGVAYAGMVYVFAADTGALLHRLTARTPRLGEGFAHALAARGRALAIGAPFASVRGRDGAGAVDVFDARTGSWRRRLHAPTPAAEARFGFAVALEGLRLLIGAPGREGTHPPRGRAHLFRTQSGTWIHSFAPAQVPAVNELFGYTVALDRGSVIIGAPDATRARQQKAGAAYAFDTTTGTLREALHEPAPTMLSQFGLAVTAQRGMLVVGAQRAQVAPGGGAVYLFRR